MEENKVGPSVTKELKKEICEMLNKNCECFAMSTKKLKCMTVAAMAIQEKPECSAAG